MSDWSWCRRERALTPDWSERMTRFMIFCILYIVTLFLFITQIFSMLWNAPVVNYFSIMTVAKHIISAVNESGLWKSLVSLRKYSGNL